MKELVIGITIAVMVLSISAMSAFAASEAPGYVDADGDGICDYAASCRIRRGNGAGFVDEDGGGICDRSASGGMRCGNGRRTHFVDSDGDGACDNAGAGCRRNG